MRRRDPFALKNLLVTRIAGRSSYFYQHPTDRSFTWSGEAWDRRHAMSKVRDAYERRSSIAFNSRGDAVAVTIPAE